MAYGVGVGLILYYVAFVWWLNRDILPWPKPRRTVHVLVIDD